MIHESFRASPDEVQSQCPRVIQRRLQSVERRCVKVLPLRRPDECSRCGTALDAGMRAAWDASTRTVRCLACAEPGDAEPASAQAPSLEPNTDTRRTQGAGASALREYERRSSRREQQIRSRHPKLGGLILALSQEPAHMRVWMQGANGERAVASRLDELVGDHLVVLHDRKTLRADGSPSRANIDHLVIAGSGVWVVDAKTHRGSLEVRRTSGLFAPRVERLFINGRDQTALVDGLHGQVAGVRAVLDRVDAAVAVRGVLCFVGTELPWMGETIGGVPLVGRRGLAKLMKRPGDLAADDRAALAAYLDARFVPA